MARTLFVPFVAGLSLFAPVAAAEQAPRTLFGQPVTEADALTEEELEARAAGLAEHLDRQGLVLIDKQVMPKRALTGEVELPPGIEPEGAWELPPHRTTIFLNFFGGMMTGGTNASEMQSPCIQGSVKYPGYGGTEQKALAIIQVFVDAASPFGIRIAYDKVPPKHLPYSQVMMGGSPGIIGLPNGVLGVACNLDCGDQWWRDTTFAFTEQTNDVPVLGTTALQEAAHAWGLDHIDGENNIMYPYATPGLKVWADECTDYNPATGAIGCQGTHNKFCGGGQQNDVAELLAYFGENSPDTVPPTVTMLSPANPTMLAEGEMVHVEVEVSDDHEGYGWRLMVPELGQEQPVYNGQKTWDFAPPKGAYTIRVEAIDHDRNVGFAEAKVYVGVDPPVEGETDTDGDSEGGSEGGSEDVTGAPPTTGASEGGSDEGNADDDAGDASATAPVSTTAEMAGDDKGCGCRSQGSAPLWALGLGLLGLRRRRRG
jgi:MYXO-CTERM domain-containing protein